MGNPNIIVFINDPSILRSTSLKLDEGLRPRRVVLRRLEGKYVTHDEYMHISVETKENEDGSKLDNVVCRHECFDHGHYYDFGGHSGVSEDAAKEQAIADFQKRAGRF